MKYIETKTDAIQNTSKFNTNAIENELKLNTNAI